MRDLFDDLVKRAESLGTSCDVTLRTLILGSADETTGWYAQGYTDSTIKMVIFPASASLELTGAGKYARVDAVGFTDSAVLEGDEITDANSRTFKVLSVEPYFLGDVHVYNVCKLANASVEVSGEGAVGLRQWILVVIVDEGLTSPEEGVNFIPEGQSFPVTATKAAGVFFEGWFLDGAEFSKSLNVTVPAQSIGTVHVLHGVTLQAGIKPINPKEILYPSWAWVESVLVGSALKVTDQYSLGEAIVQGVGKAMDDSFGRTESTVITNS